MEIGLLVGIPLLTFLILSTLDKKHTRMAGSMACLSTLVGLVISIGLWNQNLSLALPWIELGSFQLPINLQSDPLNAFMLPMVHGIALLVQIYSTQYMKGDPNYTGYFAYIQLFIFSMVGIVLGGNLLVIYIFWELVGLSSYLLIGFWHTKPRPVWAAQKAFILNRIGDAAFLSGILLLIYYTGTVEFSELKMSIATIEPSMLTVIGLLLFGGCVGKSAQFPLSAWLPDAMEGPTPVSALIHAATMVAAGIFLMARIAFLLTPTAEIAIVVVGLITMVDGALRACLAWDIKKVLAYSTQSQLGLMVVAIGLGAWPLALFHLFTHAFFKAGLFLSAGSVIHAMSPKSSIGFDPQDMRNMGGLKTYMPITFLSYLLCAAALIGLPLTTGFLSKDAIFLAILTKTEAWGSGAYLLLMLSIASAALTAYYMTRQVVLVFWGKARYDQNLISPHESGIRMTLPMSILSVGSLFFVFSLHPWDATSGWLVKHLNFPALPHVTLVPLITLLLSGVGILWAAKKIRIIDNGFKPNTRLRLNLSLLRDYQEKQRYTHFFVKPFQWVANGIKNIEIYLIDGLVYFFGLLLIKLSELSDWSDRKIVDGTVRNIAALTRQGGYWMKSLQNGKIQSYYTMTFISLILLIIWLMAGYL